MHHAMTRFSAAILFLLCLPAFAQRTCNVPLGAVAGAATPERIAQGTTDMGLGLFSPLAKKAIDDNSNIFISPFSVSSAWLMASGGAVGTTRQSMLKPLGLDGYSPKQVGAGYSGLVADLTKDSPGTEFHVANSIWANSKGVKLVPQFVKDTKAAFHADLKALPFSDPKTVSTINDSVYKATTGKNDLGKDDGTGIKNLVSRLDDRDQLVLINAIRLEAKWDDKFDIKLTKPADFTRADGSKVQVPTMNKTAVMQYASEPTYDAVSLPLAGKRYTVDFYLPKGQTVQQFIGGMTPEALSAAVGKLHSGRGSVTMPRLNLDYGTDLVNTLSEDMGMKQPFGRGADFSGMIQADHSQIGKVIHKAKLQLDESGVKATAATAITMTRAMVARPPVSQFDIHFDKPYMFVIRDTQTGSPVFMGAVANPETGN
jgi:serpin B